jgi:hypothetical protein
MFTREPFLFLLQLGDFATECGRFFEQKCRHGHVMPLPQSRQFAPNPDKPSRG